MNFTVLIIVALAWFSGFAQAQERFEFYKGVRQMAMGGASIGVVDDETALLLNPAALGKLREAYITLADPVMEEGSHDDQIAGGSANLIKMNNDPQKALNQCNANPGERLHGMGEIFPSIVFPNFGIGAFGRWSEDAEVNVAKTAFDYEFTQDYGIVAGFDFRFLDGIIKLGANGRLIDRTQAYQPNLSPSSTTLVLSNLVAEGVGFGSDAGLTITLPTRWLPSLAAVVRDVGGTSFTVRKGLSRTTATNPQEIPQTLNGAFTLSPILGNHARSLWTVEYDDILNANKDLVPQRNYHGGVEFNFYDMLFLRGGYNQGYWTAGVEMAISHYQIQLSSYGEEVGTKGALQEDRRYMASFSIRF